MEIPTEGCLCWDFFLRGCTCLKCTNRAEMHHLLGWCSRDCCTPWKAPTAQKCTIYFVGAAETAAPPGSAPTAQALHQPS